MVTRISSRVPGSPSMSCSSRTTPPPSPGRPGSKEEKELRDETTRPAALARTVLSAAGAASNPACRKDLGPAGGPEFLGGGVGVHQGPPASPTGSSPPPRPGRRHGG